MRNSLFTLLIILLNNSFFKANENIKVFIIVADNQQKSEDFDKMAEKIYFDNEYKVDKFEIIHMSKMNKTTRNITHKKKSVAYKSSLIECNDNICDKLNGLVDYNKTESTKFFFCEENPFNCNFNKFGVETILLNEKQYFTISDKIVEEIKKNKKDLTLFFYIPSKKQTTLENIYFETDTLKVEEGSSIKIKPKFTKGITSFNWVPSTNLDCNNCSSPTLVAQSNSTYKIIAKDSLGCEIISKPLTIIVENSCKYGYGCIDFVFDKVYTPKYHFENESGDEIYDWQIKSNSSGGYQFDVITTTNCATKYKVIIEDLKGNQIWEKEYLKEDVDKRSKNNYHEEYPEYNVFRFSLNRIESFILKNPIRIKILSYDEKGNKYGTCTSKRIKFTPCN